MKISPVLVFIVIIILASFGGCKKDPKYIEIHKDTTITGNQAPSYTGVSNLQVRSYVNKIYVDLIGREPNTVELNTKTNFLIHYNLGDSARDVVIQELLNLPDYYARLFELTSADMTNGIDTFAISQQLLEFRYIIYLDSINNVTINKLFYQFESNRLTELYSVNKDLSSGAINIKEYYRRFTNNYFYDQVNMGSENFVKGLFDDLFLRAPTISELTQGEKMYDGNPAILFLQNGSNKTDLENIVTNSNEFMEGLVRKSYLQLLLRKPNSTEMNSGTMELLQTFNLPAFQKKLIKMKEYAGF